MSKDDLKDRLRADAVWMNIDATNAIMEEAADRIERLEKLLGEARDEIDRLSPKTGPTGIRSIDSRSSVLVEMKRNPVAASIDKELEG